jgi:hypothetical protein
MPDANFARLMTACFFLRRRGGLSIAFLAGSFERAYFNFFFFLSCWTRQAL